MIQYFPEPYEPSGGYVIVELDLFNYATKANWKEQQALIHLWCCSIMMLWEVSTTESCVSTLFNEKRFPLSFYNFFLFPKGNTRKMFAFQFAKLDIKKLWFYVDCNYLEIVERVLKKIPAMDSYYSCSCLCYLVFAVLKRFGHKFFLKLFIRRWGKDR